MITNSPMPISYNLFDTVGVCWKSCLLQHTWDYILIKNNPSIPFAKVQSANLTMVNIMNGTTLFEITITNSHDSIQIGHTQVKFFSPTKYLWLQVVT